ncbi:hypothetical protein MTX26_24505 [Bradyrhizobium sp. ISRA443]|uniref:hypothetical protein n=1 Tax=unclassified Bradyrhizobium TaxID=2631580 RepID=UPI00247AF58C|nr:MULTISPECIES: hypothetical protein [unclassified Bradyrhizobium]WGR97555.1 hypothetical protein MTX23_24500 [Bradyrhizobium sp. ISRA436]WGS04445.1 hypothetical protein MTX18_24505 [Bradyrhizobium sp. ISRA437]WGS11326.1 hypothetical protein MTX26_24505 [Bradyrhizobium sp. ISRA443]
MTYQEIADDMGMARGITIQRALDRKRSRDGLTRAKRDSELTAKFVAVIRNAELTLDQTVRDLRDMHEAMSQSDRTAVGRSAASG